MMNIDIAANNYLNRFAILLIISSFGPYISVSYGIRAEQCLIYALLPFAIIIGLRQNKCLYIYKPIFYILCLFSVATLLTLIITMGNDNYEYKVKEISHFNRYLQSVATILALGLLVNVRGEWHGYKQLENACKALIIMLFMNSIIVVMSIFYDLSGIIKYFVRASEGSEYSVSFLASVMGRYSGIFNQPFESGVAYSIGIFAWGYLIRKNTLSISFSSIIILLFLIVGGIISVSKAFILIGIPIFLMYSFSLNKSYFLFNWRFIIILIISSFLFANIINYWATSEGVGYDFLTRLFKIEDLSFNELVSLYTAGRFGENDTQVMRYFSTVWKDSPMFGLGFASFTILDNAYLEFFVQGGLLSLICYLIILILISWKGLKYFISGSEEGRLLIAISILVWLAGFGGPILTANRTSTILFVLLILIFNIFYYEKYYSKI